MGGRKGSVFRFRWRGRGYRTEDGLRKAITRLVQEAVEARGGIDAPVDLQRPTMAVGVRLHIYFSEKCPHCGCSPSL